MKDPDHVIIVLERDDEVFRLVSTDLYFNCFPVRAEELVKPSADIVNGDIWSCASHNRDQSHVQLPFFRRHCFGTRENTRLNRRPPRLRQEAAI